jgi:hypothetical protein
MPNEMAKAQCQMPNQVVILEGSTGLELALETPMP